jgi:hypothetical protein
MILHQLWWNETEAEILFQKQSDRETSSIFIKFGIKIF